MTEDEKKQKEQEYTNLCAKLGDLFLTRDLLELDLQATREKAKNIILEIKHAAQSYRDWETPKDKS